jgi:hypothetical protein
MKTISLVAAAILLSALAVATPASAQTPGARPAYRGMPYGQYCPDGGWGPYGARRAVKTSEEAKQVVESFYSSQGRSVKGGTVLESRGFFRIEVLDSDGAALDEVAVHKRTGRIRSVY